MDYNVRNHEQRIHLRIDNSVQILLCVSSVQAIFRLVQALKGNLNNYLGRRLPTRRSCQRGRDSLNNNF